MKLEMIDDEYVDFEINWLGEKVTVLMEEAEGEEEDVAEQITLILDNIKEWDEKIKNSAVLKCLELANARLKDIEIDILLKKIGKKLTNTDMGKLKLGIITENTFFQTLKVEKIMLYSESQFSAWISSEILFKEYEFSVEAEIYERIIFDELTEILEK